MPHLTHASRSGIALLIALLIVLASLGHAAETFVPARVTVYFSPHGGATDAVVRERSTPPRSRSWCRRTASPRHRLPKP
jgi:hypothetical protein